MMKTVWCFFLKILAEVVNRFNWICHAYCLMTNHYHLVVETPEGNLSKGMRHLNGMYTQASNRRHGRTGHLFQGRFKAILVDKDSYLLELVRHVVLNLVRAKMVKLPNRSMRTIIVRASFWHHLHDTKFTLFDDATNKTMTSRRIGLKSSSGFCSMYHTGGTNLLS